MPKFFLVLIVISAVAFDAPHVRAGDTAVEVHINFDHVDFSNPVEAQKAYNELKAQARYVCDMAATYDKDYDPAVERHCEANAVVDAVRRVNRVELSEVEGHANDRGAHELCLLNKSRR